jgi:hypothetical protein
VVHGFGDKEFHLIRVIVAANGHYALNMRDITSMKIPDPEGKKYHRDDGNLTTEQGKTSRNIG